MKTKLITPLIIIAVTIIVVPLGTLLLLYKTSYRASSIRVGILHSQTGVMAVSELPVIDATMLAINEINAKGGILGKLIEPIIANGASDWPTFAAQAERLITEKHVDVIFGCWTSASRKMVKPVVEKHDNLLIYPVQYEGFESSPNIIYNGAAPNQQLLPGVTWALFNLGTTFYLVGSDYIFPRVANELIKVHLTRLGGSVVGEAYQSLDAPHFQDIVKDIVKVQPQVIINTINGSGNMNFFKELRAAGITPDKIPTMSFSIAEEELKLMSTAHFVGDYCSWNYFQSIKRPENLKFIEAFQEQYGKTRVLSDPLEAAYFGVYIWAEAVQYAKIADPKIIKKAMKGQGFDAPEGIVSIEPSNNHTWKVVRIGKINPTGQFDVVWNSYTSIRPLPYPDEGGRDWTLLIERLYKQWNNQWSAE